ncbi:hypothetical protein C8N37_102348 [Sphingobacterium faecium]|nr:hypothetical protein C8N37_102348 [Sphingobacterium faecium]
MKKITVFKDLKQLYLSFFMQCAFIKLFKGSHLNKVRYYISFGTIFSTGCKIWELVLQIFMKVTIGSHVYKLFFLKPHISNHLLFEIRT